jgi:N-glycosyltransferase
MRVLCTVTAAPSHVRNVLPVACALGAAGHDVLVVTPDALVPLWDGRPVRVLPGLTDLAQNLPRVAVDILGLPPDMDHDEFRSIVSLTLMAGPHISDNYGPLLDIARDFRPDLILRDGFEPTACLVAEALDLPHVSAPSGAGQVLDPAGLMALLNKRRTEVGLPTDDDPTAIYRYGRLDCVPTRYSFATRGVPDAFAYRQPPGDRPGECLPAWLADLPAGQPLVVAAIGGAAAIFLTEWGSAIKEAHPALSDFDPPRGLQAIVDGLSQGDHVAVVATSGIPVDRSSVGPNVHLVDWFPQPVLLECADLFVTHAGYNSIREAVRTGTPMAALPLFEDQFPNARRIEDLGLGARIPEPDAAHVAATCKRLLADPAITAQTRRAQRQMLALPLVDAAVRHLEQLAARD